MNWQMSGKANINEDSLNGLIKLSKEPPKYTISILLKPRKIKGKQYARPFLWSNIEYLGDFTISNNI